MTPLQEGSYLHDKTTNTKLAVNEQMELAMPNEFRIHKDKIAEKFWFTDPWSGHSYTADQGLVVLGQGIIVSVEDTEYNVAPVLVDSGYHKPHPLYPEPLLFQDDFYYTDLIVAENGTHNAIGMLRQHTFEWVRGRHSGNAPTVYQNSTVELPWVPRAIGEDMQIGCVCNSSAAALAVGDYVCVGALSEPTDSLDLSGKLRRWVSGTDGAEDIVGQVWELRKQVPFRGWLDKVSLGFRTFPRALAFYNAPTTADNPPYLNSAANVTDMGVKWPGPDYPWTGRGIYDATDGLYVPITVRKTHVVTSAESSATEFTDTLNITRYYDNGQWYGWVDTATYADDDGDVTTTGDAEGTFTCDWTSGVTTGDSIVITATAYGQFPGVPVNLGKAAEASYVAGSAATVGLAIIQLKF